MQFFLLAVAFHRFHFHEVEFTKIIFLGMLCILVLSEKISDRDSQVL